MPELPRWVKWVMNSDSPVSRREPAENSLPITPWFGSEPSPILVSKAICSSMYTIAPASATTVSLGVQLNFEHLDVVAENAVVNVVGAHGGWQE